MRCITFHEICLFIFTPIVVLFLCPPAEANVLPPQITGHLSSSLTTASEEDVTKVYVERASLTVECQRDCEVEAEYKISSYQSAEVVLVFVLSQSTGLEVAVNGGSVPVSKTSTIDLQKQILQKQFVPDSDTLWSLVMRPSGPMEKLYAATFKAMLTPGSNTVRVNYRQTYNRNGYGYSDGPATREFRYELWPLQHWYLADSFTMSVKAEFTVPSLADELLVYSTEWPRLITSEVARSTPADSKIIFQKVWKQDFPGRLHWFIGKSERLDISSKFIQNSIGR